MTLGSTQPLTEMITGAFPGGKGGRYIRLITLPPSCAVVMKSGNLNFLEPCGPLQASNGTALPLPFYHMTAYANSVQQCGDRQLLTRATPFCKVASTTSYTCVSVCSSVLRAHLQLTVREIKGTQNCHTLTGDQSTDHMAII